MAAIAGRHGCSTIENEGREGREGGGKNMEGQMEEADASVASQQAIKKNGQHGTHSKKQFKTTETHDP
jgi:hypothetical protein